MNLRIGCGSWTDDAYVGVLYPPKSPASDRLRLYAGHFNHVEVNSSAYRTPNAKTTSAWVRQTPDGFTFSMKLHRDFSRAPHKAATETTRLDAVLQGSEPLISNGRLGLFLLVMEPAFSPKRNQLEELDVIVSKLHPHPLAVELRNRGWVAEDTRESTFSFYRSRQLIWVSVDMPPIDQTSIMPSVDEVTNPKLAYLRLHGRNPDWARLKTTGERHAYAYSEPELNEIVTRVRTMGDKAEVIHVIANNHAHDFAPKTALELQRRLAQAG